MGTGVAPDGTIEVRVVLHVRVDPRAWAENMMGEHPDEVLHKEIRTNVKDYVRTLVAELPPTWVSIHSELDNVPIGEVRLHIESPPTAPRTRRPHHDTRRS